MIYSLTDGAKKRKSNEKRCKNGRRVLTVYFMLSAGVRKDYQNRHLNHVSHIVNCCFAFPWTIP